VSLGPAIELIRLAWPIKGQVAAAQVRATLFVPDSVSGCCVDAGSHAGDEGWAAWNRVTRSWWFQVLEEPSSECPGKT
jgi:hypothetical protein